MNEYNIYDESIMQWDHNLSNITVKVRVAYCTNFWLQVLVQNGELLS
jgi:hypothetical protein